MIGKNKKEGRKAENAKGLDGFVEGATTSGSIESFESIFVDYMNLFNFEQVDMVNPDEKID